MTGLSELLSAEAVELNLHASRKQDVLPELAGLLVRAGFSVDADAVERELLKREHMGSTGIGDGIAIPHCSVAGLSRPALAFGRTKAGIPFDAMDRKPVSLFFLLAVPPDSQAIHLQLLSRLVRLLKTGSFRTLLLSAANPGEILAGIRSLETE